MKKKDNDKIKKSRSKSGACGQIANLAHDAVKTIIAFISDRSSMITSHLCNTTSNSPSFFRTFVFQGSGDCRTV